MKILTGILNFRQTATSFSSSFPNLLGNSKEIIKYILTRKFLNLDFCFQ